MPKKTLFSIKNRPALGVLPPGPLSSYAPKTTIVLSHYKFLAARLVLTNDFTWHKENDGMK